MGLSKATNYDLTVYGLLFAVLCPIEKASIKAITLAEQIANSCSEQELDRAMNLADSIMELVRLEISRVGNDNISCESEVE